MEEPLTPSLRAEPLMIVAPSFHQARLAADEVGLRSNEWTYLYRVEQLYGRRGGRYMVYSGDKDWKRNHIEAIGHMEMPFLGFIQLPSGRVRRLVVRDRAAESE